MTIIQDITRALHDVFTTVADEAARASGFVQRASTFDGPAFVQTLVFTYLSDPPATVDDLAQTAAALGITITGSGSVQRCNETAATCLQTVLGKAVQRVLAADPTTVPVLARCAGVFLQDRTTMVLPPELAAVWRGGGGSTSDGDAAEIAIPSCCSGKQLEGRTGFLSHP